MKKITSILLLLTLVIIPNYTIAKTISIWTTSISINWEESVNTKIKEQKNIVTRKEIFNYYANVFRDLTPVSYKYIDLKYTDIVKWSKLYDSLQILVYYNLLENKEGRIYPRNSLSAHGLYTLSEKVLWVKLLKYKDEIELQSRYGDMNDLIFITSKFNEELKVITNSKTDSKAVENKKEIFQDVYKILTEQHYKKDSYSQEELLDKAIEWLTLGTNDKHTTYFPPMEKQWYQDTLNGEFEWIWAYVEMEKPWKFMIISPISGSPAHNAWLKWWDQVTHVDGKEILPTNSSKEVVSWIKWPKWTKVLLTIKRGTKTLEIEVIRDKIVIKDIETEKVSFDTFLISIKSFWPNVSESFKEALTELKEEKRIKKVIIDLRNNWGGYLDQVADMLSYIVPEGKPTTIIKYLNWNHVFKSAWYELINFEDYQIVILQNSGTASASEILAGTIKDYFPETTLLWEQSYGKWSVQRMKEYSDGSLLKYTIARWYTGWTETTIDQVWLTPDVLLEFDTESYEKYGTDNQLNRAIKLR